MTVRYQRSDGAVYRSCNVWLRRTDDLDPEVPACPHVPIGD
jgi:hypothetical protein